MSSWHWWCPVTKEYLHSQKAITCSNGLEPSLVLMGLLVNSLDSHFLTTLNDECEHLIWIISSFFQVYDGLVYKLSMEFPPNYPYTAPTVKFLSPCFHPNVDLQGNICLDILKVGKLENGTGSVNFEFYSIIFLVQ